MTVQINPPPRNPRPRATALTSYYDLDASVVFGSDPNGSRWAMDGVTFVPYGCSLAVEPVDPSICVSDLTEDPPEGFDAAVTFPPFQFQVSIACTSLSMTSDDLQKQLDVLMQSELSRIFAEQVMAGVWNPDAPNLISEASDRSQTGMTTAVEVVGAVEEALADVWGDSQGMIHVTPATLFQVASHLEWDGSRFLTPAGNVVVGDGGYQGASPASGASASGNQWVYGSSPVHYKYRTTGWSGAPWENFDYSRNIQTVRVDGVGIAVFEPCSVVSAKVDNAT